MQNYKGCWLHFDKSYIFDVFLCLLLSVYYSLIQNKQVHTEELNIKSAGQYYLDGLYNYTDRSYTTAAEQFEALSKNHPHSSYTKNSLIMEVYTNYINKEYEKIQGITDVFFSLFPNDEYTAYMYYMLAMSYYALVKTDMRAINYITDSKDIFITLLEKFPKSKYAGNVKEKIKYLTYMQQLNDVRAGDFYQNTNNYISAMRRYTGILELYKDNINPQIEEITICKIKKLSTAMRLIQNAEKYEQLLRQKYPNSKCLNI